MDVNWTLALLSGLAAGLLTLVVRMIQRLRGKK